jgi:RNA polymerase sigma-70 factor (ECF subfamily)
MVEATTALVERLFAAHGNALLKFFHRRLRVRSDAGDLAQEVYARMLRLRDTEGLRNPEAYLFTVAGNLLKEYGALNRRFGRISGLEEPATLDELAVAPDFAEDVDADRRIERLREVLKQVPARGHAALVLQYVHGLSHEEISSKLGISRRMVKKHLSQALALCRRRMSRLKVK